MNQKLQYLLELRIARQLFTAEQQTEWISLISDTANQAQIEAVFAGLMEKSAGLGLMSNAEEQEIVYNILGREISVEKLIPKVQRVYFLRRGFLKYAATILLLLSAAGGYYLFTHTSQPDKEVAIDQQSPKSNDVMPGNDKAILTLSNGQQVELSKASSNIIADGKLSIEHNNGQLSYKNADFAAMNTMTTPKGGQYQLALADGTKVWLNAASSITYPTAFIGKNREVNITGEAYFEVKGDKSKPFIVKTHREKITVLGTSFNVNAYDDEDVISTTLLEGAIKINNAVLKPGEQYINGTIKKVDVNRITAWKHGFFNFHYLKLPDIMRQISRWYDIEVRYEGDVPEMEFRGRVGRNLPLGDVLKGLEVMGVHFELKEKTLIVSQ